MPRKPRIYYTETDKTLMSDRWRKGDSLEKIAQLFDRTHSSVGCILRKTGGIRPPKRTRSRRAFSLAEREEISRSVVTGRSLRSIAASLNRAPSTQWATISPPQSPKPSSITFTAGSAKTVPCRNQCFCAGKPALPPHLRTRYRYTGQDTTTIATAYTAVSLSANA